MYDPRGSTWRKWDLHVHTPYSIVQEYGGEESWDRFIESLESLPEDIKVIGVNDYLFLDGYKKIVQSRKEGRLANLDLVLPVVELRMDKFGGSQSKLSRVNYHVIFSNELDPEVIESQFLSALCPSYVLTPEYQHLADRGNWMASPTRASLVDLGEKIIDQVPEEQRHQYKSPLIEGFNNLCVSLDAVKKALARSPFAGKAITAVGKTEWADIKWTDQSIADKKTIVNGADLVFTAASTVEGCLKSREQLKASKVNARLLDCSDAHRYANSSDKDRLGNCFTWIKSDPTFEGLRQVVYQYPDRVRLSEDRPVDPPLQLRRLRMDFPERVTLKRNGDVDAFCFQGEHEVDFSPSLTCIIGGRGTGKSTLLNLMHERISSGGSPFFRANELGPRETIKVSACVQTEGSIDHNGAEFIQQNEVENFATDPSKFTSALFSRLEKLDTAGVLEAREDQIKAARQDIVRQQERLGEYYALLGELHEARVDRTSSLSIVESFQNEEYQALSDSLGKVSKQQQGLQAWSRRFESLANELNSVLARNQIPLVGSNNPYELRFRALHAAVDTSVKEAREALANDDTVKREAALAMEVARIRGQLDEYLIARGLSDENLSDVGQASERIAKLNEQIPAGESRLKTLQDEINAFTPRRDLAAAYASEVNAMLQPINDRLKELNAEVRTIELRYEFDSENCTDQVHESIIEFMGERRGQRKDHVAGCLQDMDFLSLDKSEDFVKSITANTKIGQSLREVFSDQQNFALLKLEIERLLLDVRKLGRIRVMYDGRPIERSSFGQRCTAALIVLLMLGNTPIIIDEPEAHLDSKLIANYLVELIKSVKLHRQIIFATHNANFVVNGDAELIYTLSMNDQGETVLTPTTIENREHRDKLLALEGGQDAFERRERRYGIR